MVFLLFLVRVGQNEKWCEKVARGQQVRLPCCHSRQQRSPSQPAMRSACEVSACSGLADINAPRGSAPIQSSTARLGHQIRCVCASPAWLTAQQEPFLDRSSGCCVVASVARLMPGHPTDRNLKPDWGMVPLHRFPICAQRRKQKDETWPTKRWDRLRNLKKQTGKPGRNTNWSQTGSESETETKAIVGKLVE